jgi:phosphoglycerol transferase MdoB-like AlkP superfamily enzyme
MESTTNIILNEKYYPNMYKLYSEGMSWTNNYSPRNSCSTGNNEISGMTSLFTINNACTANLYRNNKYPESIFNLFNNAGYETSSYHNYTDQYYYRSIIHPNMGSGHFYGVQELGIPYSNVYQEWPSDVELVEKVLELTKDQDKYMVWLTSVTAHQPYAQSSEYGDKYLDLFSDTNYDISLKRYMSKLKEFDNAIGELLKGLEEQGKLDDTVIVLYGDHYPYGLQSDVLNTYFDYDVTENLQTDRTPFIIYNSEHKGAKFDTYTSYVNIVPTIANLWDFTDYDPRLYFGKDILSNNYEDRVIFADGSWQDH